MKLIRCQLEVDHLQRILDSLVGITAGITVWDAREDSKDVNLRAVYRGLEYEVSPPRLVMEIVTDDTWVEDILRVLTEAQKLQSLGDRHVRILPVCASYHVRTGFMDT